MYYHKLIEEHQAYGYALQKLRHNTCKTARLDGKLQTKQMLEKRILKLQKDIEPFLQTVYKTKEFDTIYRDMSMPHIINAIKYIKSNPCFNSGLLSNLMHLKAYYNTLSLIY